MIDPNNITNYNRSIEELQEFLLFAIVVAGKNSKIQAQKLRAFLSVLWAERSKSPVPMDIFRELSFHTERDIESMLRQTKMGQYRRIAKVFYQLGQDRPWLKAATVEGLTRYAGIGPKTARFFMLHSFKEARCAVLDTHVLKYLKALGHNVPKSTPQSAKQYQHIENVFINEWKILNQLGEIVVGKTLTLAEFDLLIWKRYNQS